MYAAVPMTYEAVTVANVGPSKPSALSDPREKNSVKGKESLKGSQPNKDFISELRDLERQDNGEGDRGPFDFRTILRKTDFAPTASLRRRRGLDAAPQDPGCKTQHPLPRLVFPPAAPAEAKVVPKQATTLLILDSEEVVEL